VRILLLAIMTAVVVHGPLVYGQSASELVADPSVLFQGFVDPPAPRMVMPEVLQTEDLDSSPVIRGQSPSTYETPPIMAPSYNTAPPLFGGSSRDPFLYGDPVIGDPGGGTILSGVNGPQPYRMGFTPKFDYSFLAPASTNAPGVGRFGTNEFNAELSHVQTVGPGWIFTNTPQFGYRNWTGPNAPNLPSSVYRLGWDLTLATPIVGLWSMQIDFNPSLNSDFQSNLARQSLNLDGNAMLFYRASPQWMVVMGVGYWDRVDKIILPYAGVVWNPNDVWEFRLLFPKSRINYFIGNFGGAAHWLYATGEYHVESYQIDQSGVSSHQQIQIQDWRFAVGLRSEHQYYDKFVEVGYVLGRSVEFLQLTPGFNINDTLMLRAGVKF